MLTVNKILKMENCISSFQLEVLSASDEKCVFAWKVEESLLNVGGTLHGGVIASVIDNTTTIALGSTAEGRRGVSMDLSVRYEFRTVFYQVAIYQKGAKAVLKG